MWLINTSSLKLESFGDPASEGISYTILSHTWGDEEVSFQEFADLRAAQAKRGFDKISKTCQISKDNGYMYTWIDTCCINKESSAELSEAINSMYEWYRCASVCYTYLSDVYGDAFHGLPTNGAHLSFDILVLDKRQVLQTAFAKCRWFTRGWTLQELLAPSNMTFFNASWQQIGDKKGLAPVISYITGIDIKILRDSRHILGQSVWQRMCWARSRETTRTEDMAYCLLGIFNINMPLIYGEGWKAFQRLQEEITRNEGDVTILLWSSNHMSKLQYRPPAYRHARLLPTFRGAFAWAVSEFLSREEVEAETRGFFDIYLVDEYGMAVPATIEMGAQQTCVVKGAAVFAVPLADDNGSDTQSVETVLEIPLAQGLFYRSVQKRAEGYVFGSGASVKSRIIPRLFREDGDLRLTSSQAAIQFDLSNDSNVHFAIKAMNDAAYNWSSWPPQRWEPWAGSWTYRASEFLANKMSDATVLGVCHVCHKIEFCHSVPSGQVIVNGPPLGYLLNLICIVGMLPSAESKSSSSGTLSDLSFIGGVSAAESNQLLRPPYNLHHILSKDGLQQVARAARVTMWNQRDQYAYQFFQSGQSAIVFVKEARMRIRIKYWFPSRLTSDGSSDIWEMRLDLEYEEHFGSDTWIKTAWNQPILILPGMSLSE